MSIQNFSLQESILSVGEDPEPGTKWHSWWKDEEPKIHGYLAHLMWWNISEADGWFVCPTQANRKSWEYPPEYIPCEDDSHIIRIERDQIDILNRIQMLTATACEDILEPYDIETLAWNDPALRERFVQAMAMYTIQCYDVALSGLFSGDSDLTGRGLAYGAVGLEVTRHAGQSLGTADMPLATIEHEEFARQARSRSAQKAALERYKNDPKQSAKEFIKACWQQWQSEPKRYATQLDFANDMLLKVDADQNGEPIIALETILKKWIPFWTKQR